jgi:hypothetical protein
VTVCVIIINKSPCQVSVCVSESGRNKTQLAGEKDSLRGGKNHSPIPNSTHIWRVGEWLSAPLYNNWFVLLTETSKMGVNVTTLVVEEPATSRLLQIEMGQLADAALPASFWSWVSKIFF